MNHNDKKMKATELLVLIAGVAAACLVLLL